MQPAKQLLNEKILVLSIVNNLMYSILKPG